MRAQSLDFQLAPQSDCGSCRPSPLEETFVDYDGVRFRISTPTSKTVLRLSMSIRCWDELARFGAQQVLEREYGSYLLPTPDPEWNVTLEYDTEKVPAEGGALTIARIDHRLGLSLTHIAQRHATH